MNERHTVVRSLHDVGAALWLGGSLMGAVGRTLMFGTTSVGHR